SGGGCDGGGFDGGGFDGGGGVCVPVDAPPDCCCCCPCCEPVGSYAVTLQATAAAKIVKMSPLSMTRTQSKPRAVANPATRRRSLRPHRRAAGVCAQRRRYWKNSDVAAIGSARPSADPMR